MSLICFAYVFLLLIEEMRTKRCDGFVRKRADLLQSVLRIDAYFTSIGYNWKGNKKSKEIDLIISMYRSI